MGAAGVIDEENVLLRSLHRPGLALRNRVVMAPLTRGRASESGVPTSLMAEYYAQRASAGLIVAEATSVSTLGRGWIGSPGAWSVDQAQGWRFVADAVHRGGGPIFLQLWHMGRMVHPDFIEGRSAVSSAAVAAPGSVRTPLSSGAKRPLEQPVALTVAEIPEIVDQFRRAAGLAVQAGLDGVEIHAANGYLIDQFLRDSLNTRNDDYGGSIEHRARLFFEIFDAVAAEIGPEKTGVRISPNGAIYDVDDSDPVALFQYVGAELSKRGAGYLHIRERRPDSTFGQTTSPLITREIRDVFPGVLILNGDYTLETATAALESGLADAIAFGRPFIANPDLVDRIRNHAPWTADDQATWYSSGADGYTTYGPHTATG